MQRIYQTRRSPEKHREKKKKPDVSSLANQNNSGWDPRLLFNGV